MMGDKVPRSRRYIVWMIRDTARGKWIMLRGPMTENNCVRYADSNPDRFKVYKVTVNEKYQLREST